MIDKKRFYRTGNTVESGILIATFAATALFLHIVIKPLMFPSYSDEWYEIVALGILFLGTWWIFIGRCVAEISVDDSGISLDYPMAISLLSLGAIQLIGKPRPFILFWKEIQRITVRSNQDGRVVSADIVPSCGSRRTVISEQYPHGMIDTLVAIAQEKQKKIVRETIPLSTAESQSDSCSFVRREK